MRFDSISSSGGGYLVKVVRCDLSSFSTPSPAFVFYSEHTTPDSETFLVNYAYEENYAPVDIMLYSANINSSAYPSIWSAHGVWSPDSIR